MLAFWISNALQLAHFTETGMRSLHRANITITWNTIYVEYNLFRLSISLENNRTTRFINEFYLKLICPSSDRPV